jgi:hypothetical protein
VSSKCFQLYYTCSDRLFAVAFPPCPFHHFSRLTVTFPKLAVILRPLYEEVPGRHSIYAHAQDFAMSDELLLAMPKAFVPQQLNKQHTVLLHRIRYTRHL